MDTESGEEKMEPPILANGLMVKPKDMEFMFGKIMINMKVSGSITSDMVMEVIFFIMEINI